MKIFIELKPEKIAPHKDALTKFLSNEKASSHRNVFECDFEDRIFEEEEESFTKNIIRISRKSELHGYMVSQSVSFQRFL